MRQRVARYRGIAPLALTVASMVGGLAVAGCSSGQPAPTTSAFAGAAAPSGSWAYPNGDLDNTRDATGSAISSANVASLKEAWTFKLAGTAATGVSSLGSLAAAPVVAGGVVYLQDLYANVYAISLASGKLIWEYQANLAEKSGPGPDGVAVADGVVYGDTSTVAFALSAATGKVLWNDGSLLNSGQDSFEIQPAVAGSGGAWETPLIGTDGSVTFGTGNPCPPCRWARPPCRTTWCSPPCTTASCWR
jgi:alcohol dehydrogenase (cytochrome c)